MGGQVIPTQIKIAAGNPGKRAEDVDLTTEAQPEIMEPPLPDSLEGDEEAIKFWNRTVKNLVENKLCTIVDGDALGILALAWSRMIRAQNQMKGETLVVYGVKGGRMKNPLLAIIAQEADTVQKGLIQFGMTPAARSRIKFPKGTFPAGGAGDKKKPVSWNEFRKGARIEGGRKE